MAVKLFKGNTSEGIDLYVHKNNELSIYKVRLNKKGDIKNQEQFSSSIEELPKVLNSSNGAAYLSIRGDAVIHKKSHSKTENLSKAVKQSLPGINPSQYKIQMYADSSGKYFSIIPNNIYEKILEQLKPNIVSIILGPFSMGEIKGEYLIPWQKVSLVNGEITIQKTPGEPEVFEKSTFDNKETDSRFLVAYANAKQHFDETQSSERYSDTRFVNFIYERMLRFFLLYGLGFIFVILLGSTFYRSNIHSEYEILLAENSAIDNQLASLEAKNSGLDEKYRFIESQKLLNKSESSKYMDRLAACLPAGIKLSKFTVNPVLKEDKGEIEYDNGVIHIEGITGQSILINEWNEKIKELEFVQKTQISSVNTKNNHSFEFIIEIIIKDV